MVSQNTDLYDLKVLQLHTIRYGLQQYWKDEWVSAHEEIKEHALMRHIKGHLSLVLLVITIIVDITLT
mgnify:CR=1 FL=1